MDSFIEITTCRAGFRVRRVNEHFATFEHRDFSARDDAERFAVSLVVRDPTLGLIDRTVDENRPEPRRVVALERAVRLSGAVAAQNPSG
jgi:hypothetical protein